MKNKYLLFIPLVAMSLVSCSEANKERHETYEYILTSEYHSDYKILQLSDIHVSNKDDRQLHYKFVDLTINQAQPDLIVLTGDSFTFASKTVAKEFFAYMDGHHIPWTITFGNHDEQCYFSVNWLTDYLNDFGSYCLFKDIKNDDVFGYANFAINLMDGGNLKEQIIIMDSNRYTFQGTFGYDCIKEDQVEWYERLVTDTTTQYGLTHSLLFFHIPVPEFQTAYDLATSGSSEAILEYGENNESPSVPETNSGLFDKVVELGSTDGIFVGHDHVNDSRILYKGVYLAYGINSTDRIYYDDNKLGGHLITVHDDNLLSFDQIIHDYSEVL